jgi:hypothetical protein
MAPPRRASRVATSREAAGPPPAEPPATAIELALRPWPVRSQRHAAKTSSMAAGKGCSGPDGTQGTAPGSRWPVPAGRPARRHCGPTRARNLRCAGTGIPGRRRYPGRQANGRAPRPRSPPLPPRHQDRMKAARGSEGGTALCQRRRGLADAGLPSVPQAIDQVLHGLARHVAIPSAQAASLIRPACHFISTNNRPGRRHCERGDSEGLESLAD